MRTKKRTYTIVVTVAEKDGAPPGAVCRDALGDHRYMLEAESRAEALSKARSLFEETVLPLAGDVNHIVTSQRVSWPVPGGWKSILGKRAT